MRKSYEIRDLCRRVESLEIYFHTKEERKVIIEVANLLTNLAQEADEIRAMKERYKPLHRRSFIYVLCEKIKEPSGVRRTNISWDVIADTRESPTQHNELRSMAKKMLCNFEKDGWSVVEK